MTFQAVIPMGGYAGWRFLERTAEAQQTTLAASAPVKRATEYFRENIGSVLSARDLVDDRQLLAVALGAFGLDDDINSQAFILKVLEEGTSASDALANRLSDTRYADFSRAFGFADDPMPKTRQPEFGSQIVARYERLQFSQAIGEQDNNLRLANNVGTGLQDAIDRNSTNTGRWFSVLGNAPLRAVFQTALGLPENIAGVDIDKQLEFFQDRAAAVFGTDDLSAIASPDETEKLIRLFLVRSEANGLQSSTGGATALALLQSTSSIL